MSIEDRISGFRTRLEDYNSRLDSLRGHFDVEAREEELRELNARIEDPALWEKPEEAQKLMQDRTRLERTLKNYGDSTTALEEALMLFEMGADEGDQATQVEAVETLDAVQKEIEAMELARMLGGETDAESAFLDINAGSGGTEAQDWAEMLLRMYLRWAERKGFKTELMECTAGEEAGIKSATVSIKGEYAYGFLKAEVGVHRLVRKSPYDSGNRRHTSFASVFAYPDIEKEIEIDIDPSDVRTDTYRASGAGGQHINKTDSAVRLTHIPTNIVVQCQNDRSQHKNRAAAWNMLKARLYEHELNLRNAEKQEIEDSKTDIGWGHQIRSYVLDQSRIKDLRTGMETGNTQAFLDGDIDAFVQAQLMGIKRGDSSGE
ncbi:peptide chain release factor 2 [Mariprofundus erugo]|uniref:Peptide chain release factor 2 n=1 Tax=Mariprofundus erugo TaxID=2528639 RepID=A0A5R9GKK1_9PROT|nr:peptide chain release factor 2 [Mariprofundus erugo]TLS66288.1 peptide chain release factor 2 [Mariprofundus erugo]TLS78223.1 peptide chain release factor 2 [Mariprofundus erugo]